MQANSSVSCDRFGWSSWAVAALIVGSLVLTAEDPGMAWDEGYTVDRIERMRPWLHQFLTDPTVWPRLVQSQEIDRHWPFAREEPDGHPPLYAIISWAGYELVRHWLPPLGAYRFGPMVLWGATLALAHRFLVRRVGVTAATAAILLCAYCPRLFGHAHFALYDVPLACFWLLAALAWWKAKEHAPERWWTALGWSLACSACLAAAAATKFTGWFIPLPLLVASWLWWPRPREGEKAQGLKGGWLGYWPVLLAIAALPLVVAGAAVWRDARELEEIDRQVRAQLADRPPAEQRLIPRITAQRFRAQGGEARPGWFIFASAPFLGAFGLLRGSLAWGGTRRTFTWWEWFIVVATVTPLLTLLLVPTWWPDPLARLALFLWSNLTRARTTWIPTQFFGQVYEFSLPWWNTVAWLVLALPLPTLVLAGWALRCGRRRTLLAFLWLNAAVLLIVRSLPTAPGHDGIRQLVPAFVFVTLAAGVAVAEFANRQWLVAGLAGLWTISACWVYHPVQLSHYGIQVGGLPGAVRLGMEATYYWDALDAEVRRWLNENTGPNEKVAFSSLPLSFHYLRQWGYLRVRFLPTEPGRLRWYVLQNRPGMFVGRPMDRMLAERGRAVFERRCLGVPLIWVFPAEELDRLGGNGGR